MRNIFAIAQKELEAVRVAGGIGSSLQAEVVMHASGAKYAVLASLKDDLRFVLITSQATVVEVADHAQEKIVVERVVVRHERTRRRSAEPSRHEKSRRPRAAPPPQVP